MSVVAAALLATTLLASRGGTNAETAAPRQATADTLSVTDLKDVTQREIVFNAPVSAGPGRSPVFEFRPLDGVETRFTAADAAELLRNPETGALDVLDMSVDQGLDGVSVLEAWRGLATDLVYQSSDKSLPQDTPGPENVLNRPVIVIVARNVPVMSLTGGMYLPDRPSDDGRKPVGLRDLVLLFDANDGHFLEARSFAPGLVGQP